MLSAHLEHLFEALGAKTASTATQSAQMQQSPSWSSAAAAGQMPVQLASMAIDNSRFASPVHTDWCTPSFDLVNMTSTQEYKNS